MRRLLVALALVVVAAASVVPATNEACDLCVASVPTIIAEFSNPAEAAAIEQQLYKLCDGLGKDQWICEAAVNRSVLALETLAKLAREGKENATKVICVDWARMCSSVDSKLPAAYPTTTCKECKQEVDLFAPLFYYNVSWIKALIKIGCEKASVPPSECETPLTKIVDAIHLVETLTWSEHDQYPEWVCHDITHACPTSTVGQMNGGKNSL